MNFVRKIVYWNTRAFYWCKYDVLYICDKISKDSRLAKNIYLYREILFEFSRQISFLIRAVLFLRHIPFSSNKHYIQPLPYLPLIIKGGGSKPGIIYLFPYGILIPLFWFLAIILIISVQVQDSDDVLYESNKSGLCQVVENRDIFFLQSLHVRQQDPQNIKNKITRFKGPFLYNILGSYQFIIIKKLEYIFILDLNMISWFFIGMFCISAVFFSTCRLKEKNNFGMGDYTFRWVCINENEKSQIGLFISYLFAPLFSLFIKIRYRQVISLIYQENDRNINTCFLLYAVFTGFFKYRLNSEVIFFEKIQLCFRWSLFILFPVWSSYLVLILYATFHNYAANTTYVIAVLIWWVYAILFILDQINNISHYRIEETSQADLGSLTRYAPELKELVGQKLSSLQSGMSNLIIVITLNLAVSTLFAIYSIRAN